MQQIIIFANENQLFKFLNMKITRTAQNEFNICELSAAELNAILTSIECSINPDFEGLPLDFMQNFHKDLCAERERMLKHERIKKTLR
ncbi:MAG: hypothetical protein J6T52_08370 [Bacteroidaceae bacterium]|nr:hypothetical protein [Bacteroidaceae bacterium]